MEKNSQGVIEFWTAVLSVKLVHIETAELILKFNNNGQGGQSIAIIGIHSLFNLYTLQERR